MSAATLPPPIADYIARSAATQRHPAWMLVTPHGRALEAGGDLEAYGLAGVIATGDACAQAPFLDGLLPVGADGLHLPWLAMDEGRFADVHVLPGDEADWVLLLDATAEAERALPFQQTRNDESLLVERSLLRTLRGFYGGDACLALRYIRGGAFRVVEEVPAWAADLAADQIIEPQSLVPFLRAFLPEAEAFYEAGKAGTLGSDPWIQALDGTDDMQMEAFAVVLEPPCRALFIAPTAEATHARQRLLQSARERSLDNERLSRDIERKDVLAHCLVHDLKGPLTCMQGYLQLALADDVPESQQREFIDLALRQCRRQEDLVDEVLDVFTAERGLTKADLASQQVVLVDLVRRVVQDFRGSFAQAGRRLRIGTEGDVQGMRVPGDASRMERVFANLLENALRHTPRGASVRVSMQHAGSELVAAIENDGAPVEEAFRSRLFERFARGASGGGSAGLGLFFCRITVERWGGNISYRPLAGGGSCFEVRLPLSD